MLLTFLSLLLLTGCNEDTVRKVAVGSNRTATILVTLRDVNRSLFDNKLLTGEEATRNAIFISETALAVKEVNDEARFYQQQLEAVDKKLRENPNNEQAKTEKALVLRDARLKLKPKLQRALDLLMRLNEEGILHVKNAEARQQLTALFLLAKSAIAVI